MRRITISSRRRTRSTSNSLRNLLGLEEDCANLQKTFSHVIDANPQVVNNQQALQNNAHSSDDEHLDEGFLDSNDFVNPRQVEESDNDDELKECNSDEEILQLIEDEKKNKNSKSKKPFTSVKKKSLLKIALEEKKNIKDFEKQMINMPIQTFEDVKMKSWLFAKYEGKVYQIKTLTNFMETEFIELYHSFYTKVCHIKRRGPPPNIPYLDSLFLILIFYACRDDIEKLAVLVDVKVSTLRKSIERTRPTLNLTLKDLWWKERIRPKDTVDHQYNFIGLLLDSSSFEVYRPRGHFKESQCYYDGKNNMYALKKEVAVSAAPPHYCLFSQPGFLGSEHDYSHFKRSYGSYLPYLKKTVNETLLLDEEKHFESWALLADLGYVGPTQDTPGLRKIIPPKGKNLTVVQKLEKKDLNRLRSPIECFFGRVKKLWKICRTTYTLDHKNFDMDIDNCFLLTNQHILKTHLNEDDLIFHRAFFERLQNERQEKIDKRKKQYHDFIIRKRARLHDNVFDDSE